MREEDKGVVIISVSVVMAVVVILSSLIWAHHMRPIWMAKMGYEQRVVEVKNSIGGVYHDVLWVKASSPEKEKE